MRCSGCQAENPSTAKFCANCGTPLAIACSRCGHRGPSAARFCTECGAVQDAAPAESAAPVTPRYLMEKLLPPRVREGERKQVTALFCDLVNSTTLAERLGPEAMHALLSRFFDLALAEVHRYQGTVNKFLGDGFLALFGVPYAHEDHALRAVLAALEIQQRLREQWGEPSASPGDDSPLVQVRMGLNTGLVVVGSLGDNLEMDFTAVGDTLNVAARLQALAEPGGIVTNDATARLVDGYVRLEPRGPIQVKGRVQPVEVFVVQGRGERRTRLEGAAGRVLSPFVGREQEQVQLDALLEQAHRGQGQVVGLVAEPGMGKSRLLYELRRGPYGQRTRYLEGRCLSYASGTPYLPILDVVRSLSGVGDTDPPSRVVELVRAALEAAGLDPRDASYPLRLLGVREEPDPLAAHSPDVVRARTLGVLREWIVAVSRQQPLLLAIEDLHWIDESSEECLAALADGAASVPLVILCTYRPGYRSAWLTHAGITQIALRPLSAHASLSVLDAALRRGRTVRPLADAILGKAEGNPLFLEELARALAEWSGFDREGGVPDTIQGLIAARIDRLPSATRDVLQTAAVLGREFSALLLAAIWDGQGSLSGHLDELARHELLYQQESAAEPTYAFKHALTQDVAYDTLLQSRRRILHRAAGRGLERQYLGRQEDAADLLAHHYFEAQEWPKALEFAEQAGRRAQGLYAPRAAVEHFTRALDAAKHLPEAEVAALHLARGRARETLGQYEAARQDYEAALAHAEQRGDRGQQWQALLDLGLWWASRDYARTGVYVRQALDVARALGDLATIARTLNRLGNWQLNVEQPRDALRQHREALGIFESLSERRGIAETHDLLGVASFLGGDLRGGTRHYERAVAMFRELDDRPALVSSMAVMLGRYPTYQCVTLAPYARGLDELRREAAEALAIAHEIGLRSGESFVVSNLVLSLGIHGEYEEALRAAADALRIAEEIGHRQWWCFAQLGLGVLHLDLLNLPASIEMLERARTMAQEIGSIHWQRIVSSNLVTALVQNRDLPAAEAVLDAVHDSNTPMLSLGHRAVWFARAELALAQGRAAGALEIAERLTASAAPPTPADGASALAGAGEEQPIPHLLMLRGEALWALGRDSEAERVLDAAGSASAEFGQRARSWRVAALLARFHRAHGRLDQAERFAASARQQIESIALAVPDDLRQSFVSRALALVTSD